MRLVLAFLAILLLLLGNTALAEYQLAVATIRIAVLIEPGPAGLPSANLETAALDCTTSLYHAEYISRNGVSYGSCGAEQTGELASGSSTDVITLLITPI